MPKKHSSDSLIIDIEAIRSKLHDPSAIIYSPLKVDDPQNVNKNVYIPRYRIEGKSDANQQIANDQEASSESIQDVLKTTESDSKHLLTKNMQRVDEDQDTVRVGDFIIYVQRITNKELVKIRKALPRVGYRQLKNLKSARECRMRRKNEKARLEEEILKLREENERLSREISCFRNSSLQTDQSSEESSLKIAKSSLKSVQTQTSSSGGNLASATFSVRPALQSGQRINFGLDQLRSISRSCLEKLTTNLPNHTAKLQNQASFELKHTEENRQNALNQHVLPKMDALIPQLAQVRNQFVQTPISQNYYVPQIQAAQMSFNQTPQSGNFNLNQNRLINY